MNLDTVDVSLDVLCYIPRSTPLTEVVAEFLRPALSAQLQVMPPMIGLQYRIMLTRLMQTASNVVHSCTVTPG